MNSVTEPVEEPPRQGGDGRNAREWLDYLATGGCDLDTFLQGAGALLQRTPEAGWDLLALMDQYYRRGKISAESFSILKAHLQGLLVGKGQRDFIAEPKPVPASPTANSTTPVPVPRAIPAHRAPRAQPNPTVANPAATASDDSARLRRPIAVGDVLRGRYVVQELLGQGTMGTVFAAVDQQRVERSQGEQRVALKVLHTDVIKRPRLFTELRREFQHLQALSHPNIVRVHEFDHDGDIVFFTMEYLSGTMLSRLLAERESVLPRPHALAIVRDVGGAIAHAHYRGVVHGDLNCGNIFITERGDVRVFDFGASHQLRRGPLVSELDTPDQVAVATSLYASCQVLEGATATPSDDIYALACVIYVLLAGAPAFLDNNALEARSARLTPARPRGITGKQWRALKAGLEFERDKRPTDMQTWLMQLDLHSAAAHLSAPATLVGLRPTKTYNSGRWMKYAAITAFIACCGWWTNQHYDALVGSAGSLQTRVKSWFDLPALNQWWEHNRAMSRKPDLVIDYPTDSNDIASTDQTTQLPEAAAKPPLEVRRDIPVTPPAPLTPRPAAIAATPTRAAAPAAAPAAIPAPAPARPVPLAVATTAASTAAPAAPAAPYNGPKAHLELAADAVEISPTDSVAHLIVRRTRMSHGEVSFSWWTESGTALPGRDFTAVPAHVETIDGGQSAVTLNIPVVANPDRQVPRNFYVVIDQPSDNATVGPRTLTMVSLVGAN